MDNIIVRELLIGVFAAVVGGLIVYRLELRLAAVSSWYRTRTAASRAKREHVVATLAANPQLLAVAYLDALIGIVFVAASFAVIVQVRNMIDPSPLFGNVAVPPEVVAQSWTAMLILVLCALLLIIVSYFVSRRISIAQEAWKRIGQTHGLPKR